MYTEIHYFSNVPLGCHFYEFKCHCYDLKEISVISIQKV